MGFFYALTERAYILHIYPSFVDIYVQLDIIISISTRGEHMIENISLETLSLGIELGSTRIKGVLINSTGEIVATGEYDWENQLVDKVWTYDLKKVWEGVQSVYADIKLSVHSKYGLRITKLGSIGFSAMMHGYLAFDKNDELLVPFRTWRNATTQEAELELTEKFNHNIPQRWSIAHYYQAVLNKEKHIPNVDFITTLAGYVHWKLTDSKSLGINDASGMFPIDPKIKNYDKNLIQIMNQLLVDKGIETKIEDILPTSLLAGQEAGVLSQAGALLLDPHGDLLPGIVFAPPEGDAGTGMIATNAVEKNTGNISAGTSVFAMIVLEKALKQVYPEIDIVMTPQGYPVAMVHVNNCTSEINAWANLFKDFSERMGISVDTNKLYEVLFNAAIESDDGLEGILSYGYHSGENITKVTEGRPLLVRQPDANFNVANLMRSHIESAFATLNIGMQILFNEGIKLDLIVGHGGIFKTEGVAQKIVATAVETPLTLMKTASEGGAWGMAVLAQYLLHNETELSHYLNNVIFADVETTTMAPTSEEIEDYRQFVKRYEKGLAIEKIAIESFE